MIILFNVFGFVHTFPLFYSSPVINEDDLDFKVYETHALPPVVAKYINFPPERVKKHKNTGTWTLA